MAGSLFPTPRGRGGAGGGGGGGRPAPSANGKPGGSSGRPPGSGGGGGGDRRDGTPQAQARPADRTPTSGDPVSIVTGDVLLTQVDAVFPAVLPLALERTNISSYRAGRWFGTSWASTLDQALELDSEGVHFLAADAAVRSYPQALLPNVEFLPTAGPQHPLVLTRQGGYTLTDPHTGRTLHFPAPGEETGWSRLPLTAITDRNGNRIDLVYEDQVLAEVRHSGGYRIIVDTAPTGTGERRVTVLRTPDGTVLKRFGYSDAGDLTEVYDSSGVPQRFDYDDRHRLTAWRDRNEHWYRYTYDERGRAVRGEGSEGRMNAAFVYDTDNRRTLVTDALGHTTIHRYNEFDQIVEETDPLGNVTRSEWDRYDRLLSRTDPLGNTVRYTYDERGNLTDVTYPDGTAARTVFNDLNLPVESTAPDGTVWRQEYDERGNPVRRTDPSGASTTFHHDERGALVSVTDALGHTTRADLDTAGLPVAITDPVGATARYTYDAMGRPTGRTDPAGAHTSFTWTTEGRMSSRTLPDGTTERWRYDGEGNVVEHTDPLGQTTRTEYGAIELPAALTRPDGSRLTFTHDAELRLTAVTNGSGLSWTYTYDPAGRLTGETDFNGRTLTYGTDAAGRLTARTNGADQTVTYVRDAFGNIVEKAAGGLTTTFAYDAMGRLVRATGPGADLHLHRDPLGQITAETGNGATVAYTRDPLGRVTGRRTPSGAEATWTYTPVGLPAQLTTGGQFLTFTHDPAGRETERRIGDTAALIQQWDPTGRLSTQTLWGAPGVPGEQARLLQHRTYAYRPDGNLTGITDRLTGDRVHTLDARGRITAVTAHDWAERYAYDDTGNLTHADHPAAPGVPDETGARQYTGTLVRTAGRTRYEHDGQGRIVLREHVTLSGQRHRWRFHWDADDRLVGAETPDGSRWRYHYDPLGRRTAKQQLTPDGAATWQSYVYAWDGTRLAEQTHHRWDPQQRRYTTRTTTWNHRPGTHTPLTQTERVLAASQEWIDQRFHAIVTDLVGAPVELVDPGGAVTPTRTNAWGAPTTGDASPCPLRLPGQYHDPETGLHYNVHRYYDPATAGYLSPDPLGLAPQPNPHAYVLNPTTWLDPLGLTPHNYGGGGDGVTRVGPGETRTGDVHGDAVVQGGTIRGDVHGMAVMTDGATIYGNVKSLVQIGHHNIIGQLGPTGSNTLVGNVLGPDVGAHTWTGSSSSVGNIMGAFAVQAGSISGDVTSNGRKLWP